MTPSTRCDDRRGRRAPGARLFVRALLLAAGALGTERAAAEPAPGDPVIAEALFKAGRELVEAGNYAAGCPKFEASLTLNPSASTMIRIAKCHEHEGKLALAWEDYHRALALDTETKGAERKKQLEAVAREGIAALEPRLPRLRIVIDHPPPGLKVLRDGKELPAATLGEALPADPGQHEVSVSAPGYRSDTRSAILEEGKTVTVEASLELVVTVAPAATPAPAPTGTQEKPRDAPAGPSTQRIVAYTLGGAGIASLAVGGILGALVFGKRPVIAAHCDAALRCDATGALEWNSAKALAMGSNISVAAGLTGLGVATTLWLIAPAKKAETTGGAATWVSAGALSVESKGAVFGLKGGF